MKPVAIFVFSPGEGPGYCASFLERHSIPRTVFQLDAGAQVPADHDAFSGLVMMGGPMSANDPTPWNAPLLHLIRAAFAAGKPCIGHCLGGQLMSRAFGGKVTINPVKEIGWNPVYVEDNEAACEWLGPDQIGPNPITTFQWHGETFSIPAGATRILRGEACPNQAYVIGNSLGMQCHVEMTPAMIESWCADWASENADAALPSVQTPAEMTAAMEENLLRLNRLADLLYTRWIKGLQG